VKVNHTDSIAQLKDTISSFFLASTEHVVGYTREART
jgi:hypothetical protein